jgi:hypothetical protein
LIEEEEMYWHKRSNEIWLLKGDNNTDYFQKKLMGKKGKPLSSIWRKMVKTLIRRRTSSNM